MSLRYRVALVTGASRGIGKEIALTLGRAGIRVAVSYHTNRQAAQRVVSTVQSLGSEGAAIPTDVTDPERVKELVSKVVGQFGRLDILVNNVGEFKWKTVVDSTAEEWHAMLASNLYSVFYTSKAVLPVMRGQRWGRVINLGSVGRKGHSARLRFPRIQRPNPAWWR